MTYIRKAIYSLLFALALLPAQAFAQSGTICPRFDAGAVVQAPPDLFSKNGKLDVALGYYTTVDQYGRTLFCFQTPDGLESPTLHVNPGDTIKIALTNNVQTPSVDAPMIIKGQPCGSAAMFKSSVNMHFHGTNTAPQCGSDEVIHTLVNSNQTFTYALKIPKDEPPGLYWYHPHVHGIASPAVQGGASGAIEVEGIANVQPEVSGLPQRYLVIRDQNLQNPPGDNAPSWDMSVNYVPVPFPDYPPAVIQMNPGTKEFWRVANSSADTILDLQLTYGAVVQPLTIVGLDGVPVGSQNGTRQGKTYQASHILVPPAGRAEFIVTAPPAGVNAIFSTRGLDTGSAGDSTPARPLAQIQLTQAKLHLARVPLRNGPPNPQRFEGLADAKVTATRHLYFDERLISHAGIAPETDVGTLFFITVKGQKEKLFDPNEKPAITTTQGAVEDWIIENHTFEPHEFHMHQIHFMVMAVDGVPVPKEKRQMYDTYQVGYWKGPGHKKPSITVRMDFRGDVVGDFVYHCHILDHEDLGMMATIRVLPK